MQLPTMLKSTAIASVLILSSIAAHAVDPAWNVRDAAEKLLDKHALRLPTDDWFLQRTDGVLLQYFRPTMVFSGRGALWNAEVRTAKWRMRENGAWGQWTIAPGKPGRPGSLRLVVIEVSTPATGGASARFTGETGWFLPFRAPGHSWVTQVR